jgi:hypothetical protein
LPSLLRATILAGMSLRRAALAALLVCAACGRQGPAAGAQTAGEQAAGEQAAGDSWTLGTIESLGEGAAYVVIVDVARWPALRRHLAALTTPLTGADGLLGADASVPWLALAGDTLGPWLSAALAAADVTRTDAAPAEPIAGMDPTRPVVLALAEAPDDAPSRSFAAGLPLITGELSGLRHELVVPAADVALLRRSLAALLDQLGASRPELVAGHSDASGWQIGDVSVAMLAGDDQVRVIAVTHALRVEATSSTLPGLLRGPTPPPLRTAGVIAAARDDAPLSVLVRARAQARLALWQIAREGLIGANSRLPARPGHRAAITRALRCETLLRDSGREFEDWTFGLITDDDSLGLRMVASLGDAGIEVFTAGASAAGAVREPASDDLLAHAWLRLAPNAMLDAAHGSSSPLTSLEDLMLLVDSCGAHMPALLAPAPFANLQQLHASARADGTPNFIGSAVQLAARVRGPGALQSAVSLEVVGADDPLQSLWPLLADALGGAPQVVKTAAAGRTRLDVGFGGPASELLGALAPAGEGLAGFHLRLAPLRANLAEQGELAPLLARDHLRADLRRSGRALVGRLTLSDVADDPAPLDLSHVTWSERQVIPPAGEACGVRAALLAAGQLDDPEALGAAVSERIVRRTPGVGGTEALDAIEAALRCPEPLPAATASNLRRLSALALAGGLVDEWRIDEAARLLERACETSRDELLCREAPALKQMIAPHIPDVFVLCDDLVRVEHAHRIAVSPAGLALDGRRVADLAALRQALEALVAAAASGIDVDLGIDSAMRFAELRPVLAALATIKGMRLGVAMRGELSDRGPALRLPIAALELGAAARSGEPARPLRDQAGTLVFAVEGAGIRLRTGMINLGVDPNPSPGSLHFDTLTRVSNGEEPLVHATDDSPWATVAIALAGTCTGARLVEPAREQELLGPAWRDADCLAVYHGPKPLSVVPRHRGPNNINSGLINVRPQLEACYAAGLIDDPKLAGRVIATYHIDAGGTVTEAAVTSTSLAAPAVLQCMAGAVRTGSHSSADGPVVVRYAFDFATKPR